MDLIEKLSNQAKLIRNRPEIYNIEDDEIKIYPLTIGQLISISPNLAKIVIEGEIKSPEEFHEMIIPELENFIEPIKEIFAELIDYDFDKLLPIDIVNILLLIIHQIDTKSFQNSIIFLMKISRNSREIIARAEQIYSIQ